MSAPTPITEMSGYRDGLTVIALQEIWRRLTGPQRRALTAYNRRAEHPRVLDHLLHMRLIDADDTLTNLGRAVEQWRPRKDGEA